MNPTEQNLPQLTQRQEEILSLIVRSYTETPEPVSSKSLVDTYSLSFSSATVRNEMSRLEELGYIAAPHTSAGRIPTAEGYRYVVRDLLESSTLAQRDQQYIENKFNALPAVLDQWLKQAATVLARTANTASLVTPPLGEKASFKHLELISIQGRLVLLVLVLDDGTVRQNMLTLAETKSQQSLSEAAAHINTICAGLNANQIRLRSRQFSVLELEVAELAADLIERSSIQQVRVIYRDGLSEIINSFPDSEGARQAVQVYEERAVMEVIFAEILQPLVHGEEVQVVIAGNGRAEMNHLSLVLSHYGVPGQISGALGVLGPTNLNYGRAISTVRTVSNLMTDMLVNLYDLGDVPAPAADEPPELPDASSTPKN